jgi:CRISPR-associated protein Csx17
VRRIEGRVLALLQSGGRRPQLVQDLLIALGEADQGLLTRPKHTSEQRLRPLQGLSTSWVEAIDDGGPEVRLAVAFATQGSRSLPLRRHIVPTERGSVFLSGPNGLMLGPELCWTGRDLVDDLVQIVLRRLSTGEKGEGLDLRPNGYTAALSDVQAFLLGRVDDARLSGLIRALFGLRRRQERHRMSAERAHTILPAFALVRSGFPGRAIPETPLEPGRDTRAAVDLAHGRAHRASEVLARRLAARGVRLRLERIVAERPLSRRLLASLAFPLSDRDMRRVLASVAYPDRNASPEGAEP